MSRALPSPCPPTYAWARKGEGVRVPRAWGKAGRVNAVAHLEWLGEGRWRLGYALRPGGCGTGEVVYLPRYSPRYNPVETVWRRVKRWLLLRRYYGSVEALRRGVEEALRELRERLEREVGQSLCMAT